MSHKEFRVIYFGATMADQMPSKRVFETAYEAQLWVLYKHQKAFKFNNHDMKKMALNGMASTEEEMPTLITVDMEVVGLYTIHDCECGASQQEIVDAATEKGMSYADIFGELAAREYAARMMKDDA